MVQSKIFSLKSYYLCIINNEIVQNSKSKPKNSHYCVPLMRKVWFSALNVLLSLIYYRGCKNLNGVLGKGEDGGDLEEIQKSTQKNTIGPVTNFGQSLVKGEASSLKPMLKICPNRY
jgi:hypothetical protein